MGWTFSEDLSASVTSEPVLELLLLFFRHGASIPDDFLNCCSTHSTVCCSLVNLLMEMFCYTSESENGTEIINLPPAEFFEIIIAAMCLI